MCDDDTVIIQSNDKQDFTVKVKYAKMSETMKDLIEDAGVENVVPLPNVSGAILEKIVQYITYHSENPIIESGEDEKTVNDITPWDVEFAKVEQSELFELILAANYMAIKSLLDLTCKTVASMIKGKTPEEIRKTFNIKTDFTPEEEEQVRKENEWCEER